MKFYSASCHYPGQLHIYACASVTLSLIHSKDYITLQLKMTNTIGVMTMPALAMPSIIGKNSI